MGHFFLLVYKNTHSKEAQESVCLFSFKIGSAHVSRVLTTEKIQVQYILHSLQALTLVKLGCNHHLHHLRRISRTMLPKMLNKAIGQDLLVESKDLTR